MNRRALTIWAGLASVLIWLAASCGRQGPTAPGGPAGPAGRVTFKFSFPPEARAALIDSVDAAIFVGGRIVAGPVRSVPDDAGGFRLELVVPSGAGRVAAVRAIGTSFPGTNAGPAPGVWFLGLSQPFTVGAGDTAAVEVGFTRYLTQFIVDQRTFVGSATLRWPKVERAAGYRVSELVGNGFVDRTTTDTLIVIPANAGDTGGQRAFRVRAESPYAAGAWSAPVTITITPQPTSGWVLLHDGTGVAPPARLYPAGAYHPGSETLFLFPGGRDSQAAIDDSTLWTFTVSDRTWRQISSGVTGGPGPITFASLGISNDAGAVFIFGGVLANTTPDLSLWRYDVSARRWSRLSTSGQAVEAGITFDAILDASLWVPAQSPGQLLVYLPKSDEIYAFDLGKHVWSRLPPVEPSPGARSLPASSYDTSLRTLIVFGGELTSQSNPDSSLWLYSEADGQWSTPPRTASPSPPAREWAGCAPGPGGSVFLFGGAGTRGSVPTLDDVWRFTPGDPGSWQQIDPGGVIGPRLRPAIGYDPELHRLIVCGTYPGAAATTVWALKLQ